MICKSIYHYARECPNAEDKDSEITETYNSMDAQFTLFCAYTNSKLRDLTKECNGYAIIDTGCANTVCGEEWMNKFIEKLSDEERERMTIESSEQSFTFGDGVPVPSLRRVTMPCWMGGVPGTISTDVIDGEIPLLLSKKSMKRNKMKIDLETDEVVVNNRRIRLKVTKTDHYALPISL